METNPMATATAEKKTRKRRKVNRSALIRSHLESNPTARPKEIAVSIKKEHRIIVSPQLISNLKHQMGSPTGTSKFGRPSSSDILSISALVDAKKLVDQLGIEKVKRALDVLAKLR